MKLSELKIPEGSRSNNMRVGRGLGCGKGKTCGRGQKGAGSRSGGATNPGFEGGQTPLYRRIPKRGFNNINRKEFAVINLDQIEKLGLGEGSEVDCALFMKDIKDGVKVLGDGEISVKLTIVADAFSKSAIEKIEKVGGTAKVR
jgi:large subunit ribosomal protein L15